MIPPHKIWALVPAAGSGQRMGTAMPKQYLPLAGKTVLQITLGKLGTLANMHKIIVALAPADSYFDGLKVAENIVAVTGGCDRAGSVLNGLRYLQAEGADDDWVLVHDAARPCVQVENILRLMEQVQTQNCGGILAAPVADTLKKAAGGNVAATVDRTDLWSAHTPQMFRIGELSVALAKALNEGMHITDEASAIEYCGGRVLLVADSRDNIKITQPEDLWLAEQILQRQGQTRIVG